MELVVLILNMCVQDFCVVSMVWPVWVYVFFYGFWFVDWYRF